MGLSLGMFNEAQADERTGEVQEGEHRGGLAVVVQGEPAVGQYPCIGPFKDPATLPAWCL